MDRATESDPVVLLDACAAINLFATRRMDAILGAIAAPVGIVALVHAESLYVLRGGAGDDADVREPVDLQPLVGGGVLRVVEPTEAELDDFVDLAAEMDDGEAMTAAVAIARGWSIVTDDRKATRILAGRVWLQSTLAVVKDWADRDAIDDATVARVLTDLRERGTYLPGRAHPLRGWWDTYTG